MKLVSHRGYILYVPAQFCLPRKVSKVQEVVYHHLANQIMARESVKVVDAEVQLPARQLSIGYRKEKHLIEQWVECLAVHLGLVLGFAVGQQVNLDVRI